MSGTTAEKLAELRARLELAKEPAGEIGIAKRAKKGIPSARDRVNLLNTSKYTVDVKYY